MLLYKSGTQDERNRIMTVDLNNMTSDEVENTIFDCLSDMSGEDVARRFGQFHGYQLFTREFLEFLSDEGCTDDEYSFDVEDEEDDEHDDFTLDEINNMGDEKVKLIFQDMQSVVKTVKHCSNYLKEHKGTGMNLLNSLAEKYGTKVETLGNGHYGITFNLLNAKKIGVSLWVQPSYEFFSISSTISVVYGTDDETTEVDWIELSTLYKYCKDNFELDIDNIE
jgi:hypothetical protein